MRTEEIPQGWLGQNIELAAIRRLAPTVAAPSEVRSQWQAFLEAYEPGDELRIYHTCYDDRLAKLTCRDDRGWSGFVIVRLDEIVASYDL